MKQNLVQQQKRQNSLYQIQSENFQKTYKDAFNNIKSYNKTLEDNYKEVITNLNNGTYSQETHDLLESINYEVYIKGIEYYNKLNESLSNIFNILNTLSNETNNKINELILHIRTEIKKYFDNTVNNSIINYSQNSKVNEQLIYRKPNRVGYTDYKTTYNLSNNKNVKIQIENNFIWYNITTDITGNIDSLFLESTDNSRTENLMSCNFNKASTITSIYYDYENSLIFNKSYLKQEDSNIKRYQKITTIEDPEIDEDTGEIIRDPVENSRTTRPKNYPIGKINEENKEYLIYLSQ